ncbi:peptidoglycan DD-metalloendopeptidase family protein [Halomonas sp. MCCC 1A17488]|uniref:murein hydrolase activator EnvC family protein n=1 Tax=unclassified Halomonas TaxID=2609666 RepID=UPI0018D21B43|nr:MULTISPECIES: peptidoglycan DD-metalloendopeptidase family protein [unclassified Halomonas]MCE8017230.1 peptidoglycan DD-metalloendopeptidase family protein [Halomonas sp. MCCC 1A17488]MCG3240563.1 peptidoglycan DD-metalloendopeptidase family protein [Halomonas sp. MCCC 1A17488]QPP49583.1 peptidoglycan DD-metalloendopeptidase family protein [Halomonas sp. SS10-MC5]
MSRPWWRHPSRALLVALAMLPGLIGDSAQAQPSEREARERLDAIGSEIQALSRRLGQTRQAQDEASRELREVETALAETHRRLDAIQADRRRLADEIAALESARDALREERAEQVEALDVQLDALYRLGLTPQLKLLLNQDDPARLDRLQTYLNHLARARNERLDEIARLDVELSENRRELQARGERMDALADELATRSSELTERMAERERLVAELDARYSDEQSRLARLDRDRTEAEQVLERVREELARLERPPPSTAIERTRGNLPWPVQGNVASGYRRDDGVHYNGILIEAREGTPVEAVHAGRVVFSDWMRGFGNLLILDHGDNIMTLYAHLQHFSVEVGEAVSRGDAIGTVGNSGGHTTSALYFEVRRNGDPIDPQAWIARR